MTFVWNIYKSRKILAKIAQNKIGLIVISLLLIREFCCFCFCCSFFNHIISCLFFSRHQRHTCQFSLSLLICYLKLLKILKFISSEKTTKFCEVSPVDLFMDFLIDGQISSFCPDQLEAMLLTLIMLGKLTQSL
jgi:hypothetical protein